MCKVEPRMESPICIVLREPRDKSHREDAPKVWRCTANLLVERLNDALSLFFASPVAGVLVTSREPRGRPLR